MKKKSNSHAFVDKGKKIEIAIQGHRRFLPCHFIQIPLLHTPFLPQVNLHLLILTLQYQLQTKVLKALMHRHFRGKIHISIFLLPSFPELSQPIHYFFSAGAHHTFPEAFPRGANLLSHLPSRDHSTTIEHTNHLMWETTPSRKSDFSQTAMGKRKRRETPCTSSQIHLITIACPIPSRDLGNKIKR